MGTENILTYVLLISVSAMVIRTMKSKMKTFTVSWVAHGLSTIKAKSKEEAQSKIENMSNTKLYKDVADFDLLEVDEE